MGLLGPLSATKPGHWGELWEFQDSKEETGVTLGLGMGLMEKCPPLWLRAPPGPWIKKKGCWGDTMNMGHQGPVKCWGVRGAKAQMVCVMVTSRSCTRPFWKKSSICG